MAAADPILSPEEVALLVLDKVTLDTPLEKNLDQHPRDHGATLPWDQCHPSGDQCHPKAPPEPLEPKSCSPPEGDTLEDSVPKCPSMEAKDEDPPLTPPHVFVPIDPHCIEQTPGKPKKPPNPQTQAGWRGGSERPQTLPPKPFQPPHPTRAPILAFEGLVAKTPPSRGEPRCPWAGGCRDNLKAVASGFGALFLCPCFLYGAFVFLPFDAPPLPTPAARLVYTLRCAAFATFPILLGMIVSGVSRLCSSALEPFGELERELELHRTYVSQSIQLFILYFFNMAVLVTYLPQELLKLIPLLTGLFAISRLIFWLSYAIGRSFRVFGFSMTFLPLLAMQLWNLYSMFFLEPENLFALGTPKPEENSKERGTKLRYWG
ncbi:transmembrane protein 79 [Calypte anna]|uniref:transmembrane protein 79 n=1 Tax=Calypte anna TaxID=9244 RepID=UPI0011C3456D|nr:transmembrane protein 79 [Calypte anna]